MGKIVVSENVSLDGVVQDPTGEEGFKYGGWFNQMGERDREEWATLEYHEALGADALLLGRRTDEYFGTRWNDRTGDWADRLNALPKYVVSSTAGHPVWVNGSILTGDVVAAVSKLTQAHSRDIVVYGSRQLVRTLMEHALVDEVRLLVFPCALGSGDRLFGEASDATSLRLIASRVVGDSLVHLTYEVLGSV